MINYKISSLLLLSIALILVMLYPESTQYAYGSPSFGRQQIIDPPNDWFIKNATNSIPVVAPSGELFYMPETNNRTTCLSGETNYSPPDISGVTYSSDGKKLNATIWLYHPFTEPNQNFTLASPSSFMKFPWHNFGYTMSIDEGSVYNAGTDYFVTIQWDPIKKMWIRTLEEGVVTGDKRILEENDNFTGFFDAGKKFILFSVDLNKISSPEHYKMIFTAWDEFEKNGYFCDVVDLSNWAQAPPPDFAFSILPDSVILKPGEETTLELQIKSLTKVESIATLTTNSVDGLELNLVSNKTYIQPLGVGTLLLHVKALENAGSHAYTIPMNAYFSFPTVSILRGNVAASNQLGSIVYSNYNFVVTVKPPLTLDERFATFWSTYGGIVSLVGGGLGATMTKMIIDKIQEKRKRKRDQKDRLI